MPKTDENKSATIKNRTVLHTLSTICDIIDIFNKYQYLSMNINLSE